MKKSIIIVGIAIMILQIYNILITLNVEKMLKRQEHKKKDYNEVHTVMKSQRGPNIKELKKIELPQNPSKEQIEEYIENIILLAREQTTFSPRDPQVELLTKIGYQNMDYLLNEFYIKEPGGYYIVEAIKNLARDEDKEKIIDFLPICKRLAEIICKKGWQKDAKGVLVKGLKAQPDYLPTEWINAVASFNDPSTYRDLKRYMIHGSNRMWTYEDIKDLHGIGDLSDTVAEAWDKAKKDKWQAPYFVSVALKYGHKDALKMAVESLGKGEHGPGVVPNGRAIIMEYSEISGSDKEIEEWYKKNWDKLIFDKERRKFIIKGDDK